MSTTASPTKKLLHTIRAAAATYGVKIETRISRTPTQKTAQSWPRTDDPIRVTVSLPGWPMPPDFVGDPDDPDYDDSPAAHQERTEHEIAWRNDLEMERSNQAEALISAFRAAGLAIDADGGDPREVLAEDCGEWIVSWRS
jgi:hypothetical protein